MTILITGGRGSLGRLLVPRLAGHSMRIGTRRPRSDNEVRFDLADEEGIIASVEGADVIIHLATDPFHGELERDGSEVLFEAAAAAGISHVLYVSIVGIDQHPYPYYRTKLSVEQKLEASDVPWTILRATQFHSLVPRFVDELSRSPILPVPTGVRLQPIDPVVVADRVAKLVRQGPSARVSDLGGPEVLGLKEMAQGYLNAIDRRRLLLPLPLWGGAIGAFRRGDVLTDMIDRSGRTYRQYLAEER